MRSLEECSGPWVGHWIQADLRGSMRMRLHFAGGAINGSGMDGDGPFRLSGRYDPEDAFAFIDKAYAMLNVQYRGQWDGQMISGHSVITAPGFYDTGEFEIWPESDTDSLRFEQTAQLANSGNSGG